MNDNPFLLPYKTTDTSVLLDIIDSASDYQPLAVEAARLELDSRQLTQEQLAVAKAEQNLRHREKANKQQRVKNIEDRVKSVGSSLAETFNPIQKDIPTTDKLIKLISLFIGGLFLYKLYKEFGMLRFMFTDDDAWWDFSMLLYFAPLIILPTAGLLFSLRKKIGWTLVTIYFSYSAVGTIPALIMVLNRKPTGVQALDLLYPTTSPTAYIGTLLFFGGLTWTLCNEDIREVYQVDKKSMLVALGIGTGIIILMTMSFGL